MGGVYYRIGRNFFLITVTSLTKLIYFRQKITREFKNSGMSTLSVYTFRPSRDQYRSFKSEHRC